MKKIILASLLITCFGQIKAQSLSEMYQKVNSSVVVIQTMSTSSAGAGDKKKVNTEGGLGSGVLISDDGLIWTASHVVHTAEQVALKFTDGDIYEAEVLSSNPTADVALIKIMGRFQLKDKHVAAIGNSDELIRGQDIFVIGAPRGLEQTLSRGIISGRLRPEKQGFIPVEFIQTDASINPGNSGGPMFNMNGEVIGIASFILSESGGFDGIGFGASSNVAEKILMEQQQVWSGAEFVYLEEEMAAIFNVAQKTGMMILTLSKNGLIAKAGLRGGYINAEIEGTKLLIGGDIILEIAGIKINKEDIAVELRKKLISIPSGQRYTIKYLRNGEILTGNIVKE